MMASVVVIPAASNSRMAGQAGIPLDVVLAAVFSKEARTIGSQHALG
jgi:hypothetical protein